MSVWHCSLLYCLIYILRSSQYDIAYTKAFFFIVLFFVTPFLSGAPTPKKDPGCSPAEEQVQKFHTDGVS